MRNLLFHVVKWKNMAECVSNRAIICTATIRSPSELDKTLMGVYVKGDKAKLYPKVLIRKHFRIYARIKKWLVCWLAFLDVVFL